MTSFDRREEAFEAKFAHDEELAFKSRAHAVRMLGLWAAGKRGETGTAAENYARALVEADVGSPPDAAIDKLALDLAGHGVDAAQIRKKRDALFSNMQTASASAPEIQPKPTGR
ncbi:MAG: DUF1476 domain-containing protein [Bradyrhizobium sp.]|nr:DUF1476 domain-containing protein [Bradyrhizobium sp.]